MFDNNHSQRRTWHVTCFYWQTITTPRRIQTWHACTGERSSNTCLCAASSAASFASPSSVLRQFVWATTTTIQLYMLNSRVKLPGTFLRRIPVFYKFSTSSFLAFVSLAATNFVSSAAFTNSNTKRPSPNRPRIWNNSGKLKENR